ncbi:phosphate regulon sensor histidine kinase PhoR [Lysobacter sp. HDW10]|uniref:phosphate regulon sensor histidine kinase PhoR n=1 Tax=Lysobacter sp. HDW10 TaxID=2714936 RepID=UPI00140C6CD0|nr:phosphate regulon sensor histidine kinase PhoR [Lysobacter sp. HDW10]QIK81397.1 phosphate regulon sensor histidine kinase PhoR [Lysobacter sp. HDW10]
MNSALRTAWLKTLWPVAALLGAALLIGLLTQHVWMALALTAIAIVAWQLWQLRTLLGHLNTRSTPRAPEGGGIWNEIIRVLSRRHHAARARKKRLVSMLRVYGHAGASFPDAVVVISGERNEIEWFNDAATALLGLAYPRDVGSSLDSHLMHLSVPGWLNRDDAQDSLPDEASPVDANIRLALKLFSYTDSARILIARDVSKLMHLEQVRHDFVANVSHELRTPLTVLHGYLDLLDDEEDPERSRMFTEMRQQSLRMNHLVEDLLTLSRLEAQEPSDEDVVSMPFMLAALRREAEALSGGQHVIRVSDDAHVDLWGSNKELHSAFSNLISNAVRYTPKHGEIDIQFRREGEGAALSVRDSGYGIPSAQIPRITERFYRVSNSRSRELGGTGLGLSIVKHVLNNHGASLEIESDVGKGSTFTCHLSAHRIVPRRPLSTAE